MKKQKQGENADAAGGEDDDEPWERPNALSVPEIRWGDLTLSKRILGRGRNGPVVEGYWRGVPVAIKHFDLDHGGGPSFQREIEAYAGLRDLQGKAVARLLL